MPNLRAMRRQRGLTQQQLADMVGVHKYTISNYERGAKTPSLKMVRKLATALECQVADII